MTSGRCAHGVPMTASCRGCEVDVPRFERGESVLAFKALREPPEEGCPPGTHWDPEVGKCAKDAPDAEEMSLKEAMRAMAKQLAELAMRSKETEARVAALYAETDPFQGVVAKALLDDLQAAEAARIDRRVAGIMADVRHEVKVKLGLREPPNPLMRALREEARRKGPRRSL